MKRLSSRTTRPIRMAGLMILFPFLLAACAPAAAVPQAAATGLPPANVTVKAADNQKFGKILVDASGMTLYTFEIDTPEVSKCTSNQCVAFWPPSTVNPQPTVGTGVTGALSTISRPDGAKQVTYDGKPLYTFAIDKKPGDAAGDGINEFGGTWHVVILGGSATSSDSSNSGGYPY